MKTNNQSGSAMPIVAGVLIFLIIGTLGVVFFSRDAAPGDPLYNVRVFNEGVQYALTPSTISKAELALANSEQVANQIKRATNQPHPSVERIQAGADALTNEIQQATQAAQQSKPASYSVMSVKSSPTKTGSSISAETTKPVVTGGADNTKYAALLTNLINTTQNSTVTLQQAAIKVPSTSANAKQAISKLQANLHQQAVALQSSSNSVSNNSSSGSTSNCFSSISTQLNGQPPVSQTSSSCNSVLTNSGKTYYNGRTILPPPSTSSSSTGTSSSSSSCHSISTQTINGVSTTQESYSCNSTLINNQSSFH